MTIKEQKLALYKQYIAMTDRGHLAIRGLNGEELDKACAATNYEDIVEVPKKYTVPKLKAMLGCE